MRPPWTRNASVPFPIPSRPCMLRSMFAFPDRVLILIAACGIEAVLAYPAILFGAIGHPVSWIGAAISALESWLNRPDWSDTLRRAAGVTTTVLLVAVGLGVGLALEM